MIYPSIDSLLDKIDSKYSLVTISAQRARELQEKEDYDSSLHKPVSNKLVGVALEEIQDGKLTIKKD
ncbi:DNA-directed RNA polymerase subunit omega [Geomicrobium halophilum]|uniref:DNA-directed RNA polymerase subunit omega n=1 Tax=Geomicrobium halophilum TaxID=549000 RepID=A0A841PSS3_9BACL|nr:DNA-directed RNA polymerase subunit omega [Geomicrobium halophilum]MBB6449351.1 DNA-directed RNA polymerase subunit omega [Geomicrobium halophilum]